MIGGYTEAHKARDRVEKQSSERKKSGYALLHDSRACSDWFWMIDHDILPIWKPRQRQIIKGKRLAITGSDGGFGHSGVQSSHSCKKGQDGIPDTRKDRG